jgi:sugar O-acyltransferase (sialic acid O-acetyltransferase NeuD family)
MEKPMSEAFAVIVPLLNPNEPEVQIVEVHVAEGQKLAAGELLCTVETTKSTHEISAEREGYVVALGKAKGDKLRAGERLCWLADDASWVPPEEPEEDLVSDREALPQTMRITRPALELARASGLDLEDLPQDILITEAEVLRMISDGGGGVVKSDRPLDSSALIIYGGGGHGKALIDLIHAIGSYRIAGIIDDGLTVGVEIMGIPVVGGAAELRSLSEQGIRQAVNAVGGIGDMSSRTKVFERLQVNGFELPNLIHPSAWVEPSVSLEAGVQTFPHAYIGSEVRLGLGVIVNTAAVVSHDCNLADYVNIAPGALLAGNVTIGEGVLVGMGVTINLHVNIGSSAMIGNSAVTKADVPAGQVVRAGTIWPRD